MLVEVNDALNIIVSAMLYFIISFGLFGTILMMLAERKREFGMLIAIGMKKSKLSYITYLENTFMAVFGTALGFVIAIPVVYYLNQNPITLTGRNAEDIAKFGFEPLVKTSMNFNIFMWQAISVLGISLFFSLYPILKIRSMNENKAMKG
jgi:ABC-type antimicrobial peptide transport system permease subunit